MRFFPYISILYAACGHDPYKKENDANEENNTRINPHSLYQRPHSQPGSSEEEESAHKNILKLSLHRKPMRATATISERELLKPTQNWDKNAYASPSNPEQYIHFLECAAGPAMFYHKSKKLSSESHRPQDSTQQMISSKNPVTVHSDQKAQRRESTGSQNQRKASPTKIPVSDKRFFTPVPCQERNFIQKQCLEDIRKRLRLKDQKSTVIDVSCRRKSPKKHAQGIAIENAKSVQDGDIQEMLKVFSDTATRLIYDKCNHELDDPCDIFSTKLREMACKYDYATIERKIHEILLAARAESQRLPLGRYKTIFTLSIYYFEIAVKIYLRKLENAVEEQHEHDIDRTIE